VNDDPIRDGAADAVRLCAFLLAVLVVITVIGLIGPAQAVTWLVETTTRWFGL
jgi:hypothetical protein